MFNLDAQENFEEQEPAADFKAPNVTNYTKQFSPFTPFPQTLDASSTLDFSLDLKLSRMNASQLKKAIQAYMKHCLINSIEEGKLFQNGNIMLFQSEGQLNCDDEVGIVELINGNPLLTPFRRKSLIRTVQQFQELKHLLSEINNTVGKFVTQEIIFILAPIIQEKIQELRQILKQETVGFLPRMERFWGDNEQENFFEKGWDTYENLDYDEIKTFGSNSIEKFSSHLYFSKEIKFMNLSEINEEKKQNINVMDKFTTFLTFLCENIFLGICGMSQTQQDLEEFYQQLRLASTQSQQIEFKILCKRVKTD